MTPVYKLSASSIKGRTNYGSMLAGNAAFVPVSYESIATATPTSGSVIFSNIPSTYTHLQIRMIGRSGSSASASSLYIGFNSTEFGANNYDNHLLVGNGSSATAASGINATQINGTLSRFPTTTVTSNVFAGFVIDILDYANTNKNTTVRYLGGYDANGAGFVMLGSALWRQTAAVNRIYLEPDSGFVTGTHLALYGIRSAQ